MVTMFRYHQIIGNENTLFALSCSDKNSCTTWWTHPVCIMIQIPSK